MATAAAPAYLTLDLFFPEKPAVKKWMFYLGADGLRLRSWASRHALTPCMANVALAVGMAVSNRLRGTTVQVGVVTRSHASSPNSSRKVLAPAGEIVKARLPVIRVSHP